MRKIISTALGALMVLAVSAAPSFAAAPAAKAAVPAAKNYWDGWTKVYSLDMFPECGVKPGGYVAYINPKVMNIYKKKGKKYPDGQVGVLVFKHIGAAFTTDIKDGKPIMDVKAIADGKSIASKDKGHPLNPETCFNCHETVQKGVCKSHGYVCGDVVFRTK